MRTTRRPPNWPILQRDADVPFRVGHHFASELVKFRQRRIVLRPMIFLMIKRSGFIPKPPNPFKLDQRAIAARPNRSFENPLTAENMVQSARVVGGPPALGSRAHARCAARRA